jgi:hypothetical protein
MYYNAGVVAVNSKFVALAPGFGKDESSKRRPDYYVIPRLARDYPVERPPGVDVMKPFRPKFTD